MLMVRNVVGGVDTHADMHVAAVIDSNGGLLGVEAFPADAAGYEGLVGWLAGFGAVARVGVEGTGSWGVGLSRFLTETGVEVVEVDRPNRQVRRRQGKSDATDAVAAARAALSGAALVTPKARNGPVEQSEGAMSPLPMQLPVHLRVSVRLEHSEVGGDGLDLLVGEDDERHVLVGVELNLDRLGRLAEDVWSEVTESVAPVARLTSDATRCTLK